MKVTITFAMILALLFATAMFGELHDLVLTIVGVCFGILLVRARYEDLLPYDDIYKN